MSTSTPSSLVTAFSANVTERDAAAETAYLAWQQTKGYPAPRNIDTLGLMKKAFAAGHRAYAEEIETVRAARASEAAAELAPQLGESRLMLQIAAAQ